MILQDIIVNFIGDITNRIELIEKLNLNKDIKNSKIISFAYKKWGSSFAKRYMDFFNRHIQMKKLYSYKRSSWVKTSILF